MYFNTNLNFYLLFEKWMVMSTGQLVGACFAWILFCFLFEFVKNYRAYLLRQCDDSDKTLMWRLFERKYCLASGLYAVQVFWNDFNNFHMYCLDAFSLLHHAGGDELQCVDFCVDPGRLGPRQLELRAHDDRGQWWRPDSKWWGLLWVAGIGIIFISTFLIKNYYYQTVQDHLIIWTIDSWKMKLMKFYVTKLTLNKTHLVF